MEHFSSNDDIPATNKYDVCIQFPVTVQQNEQDAKENILT
jgi:hypothetical protein